MLELSIYNLRVLLDFAPASGLSGTYAQLYPSAPSSLWRLGNSSCSP